MRIWTNYSRLGEGSCPMDPIRPDQGNPGYRLRPEAALKKTEPGGTKPILRPVPSAFVVAKELRAEPRPGVPAQRGGSGPKVSPAAPNLPEQSQFDYTYLHSASSFQLKTRSFSAYLELLAITDGSQLFKKQSQILPSLRRSRLQLSVFVSKSFP